MQKGCLWFRLSSLLIPSKELIQQALMAKLQMVLLRLEASSMFAEACSEAQSNTCLVRGFLHAASNVLCSTDFIKKTPPNAWQPLVV